MEKNDNDRRMLLIVDPQIDFITGTLPVPGAEGAMDALAHYVREHGKEYEVIIVTCDRHPLRHCSFNEFGGQWPSHCVESSVGAAIWPPLMEALVLQSAKVSILYKGEHLTDDDYSIFHCEGGRNRMAGILCENDVSEIDICGLAGDVCVAHTLEDARRLYPSIRYRILKDFTASLDSGMCIHRLEDLLAQKQ